MSTLTQTREKVNVSLGRCPNTSCDEFIYFWRRFWQDAEQPVALLHCDNYLDSLDVKRRKLLRGSQRHYDFREFDIVDEAGQVYALNQSRLSTSQGDTYGWLRQPVFPLPPAFVTGCEIHRDTWYGGFGPDGVLRGYLRVAKLDELGVTHLLFRHAEHSASVTNGLFAHVAEHGGIRYLSYHTMNAEPHTGRPDFKRRIGCRETWLEFE